MGRVRMREGDEVRVRSDGRKTRRSKMEYEQLNPILVAQLRLVGPMSAVCKLIIANLCDGEVEESFSLVADSCLLLAFFQIFHQPPDLIGNLTGFVKVCTA